jgi:hypothetical protein
MPLAGFKRKAAQFDADRRRMYDEPFAYTLEQIVGLNLLTALDQQAHGETENRNSRAVIRGALPR